MGQSIKVSVPTCDSLTFGMPRLGYARGAVLPKSGGALTGKTRKSAGGFGLEGAFVSLEKLPEAPC